MSTPRVLVIGGINMDLVVVTPRFPAPGETVVGERFFITPGGKGANQAVACARLGARCSLVGRVGNDTFGQDLLASLNANGVHIEGVGQDDLAPSGVAFIEVDATGQNRIVQVVGANGRCGMEETMKAQRLLRQANALLFPLEVSPLLLLEVARTGREQGVLVVFNPAPVKPFPEALYRLAHYIVPNETEASALVGHPVNDVDSVRRAAATLLGRGCQGVIITLGERGAFYKTADAEALVPAFPVKAVDTVGAGDAFCGALTVALAEGMPLPEAVRFANAAGAVAVTKPGAQTAMPTREEVEHLLRSFTPRPG
ncbi:MAG: ribokinase [Dehalococcoidia bacterium]|nr:ribokinase [Dehalococcoidia bacterium]MDW8119697.1 ribokinase [Chloroflexota bacterium]